MRKYYLLYFLVITLSFSACKGEDEYVYPSVLTELISLQTDAEGKISSFTTDKGKNYQITNGYLFTTLLPDTTYRMSGIYEINEEDESAAYLYSLTLIFSNNPIPASELEGELIQDPVEIESIWISGGYINFAALVKVHSKNHIYNFIESDFFEKGGVQHLNLNFYHDRQEDIEGYTQRTYFSIPLHSYNLRKGDILDFSFINYEGALKTYTFLYINKNLALN